MPLPASIFDFYKVTTTPGTPVSLGLTSQRFNSVTLYGMKASQVNNTGNVRVRGVGGTGWISISPGSSKVITAPAGSFFRADQFQIDADTTGDGVFSVCTAAIVYEGP